MLHHISNVPLIAEDSLMCIAWLLTGTRSISTCEMTCLTVQQAEEP